MSCGGVHTFEKKKKMFKKCLKNIILTEFCSKVSHIDRTRGELTGILVKRHNIPRFVPWASPGKPVVAELRVSYSYRPRSFNWTINLEITGGVEVHRCTRKGGPSSSRVSPLLRKRVNTDRSATRGVGRATLSWSASSLVYVLIYVYVYVRTRPLAAARGQINPRHGLRVNRIRVFTVPGFQTLIMLQTLPTKKLRGNTVTIKLL